MTIKFYAAIDATVWHPNQGIESAWGHITLSFFEPHETKKLDINDLVNKIRPYQDQQIATVSKVEYWEKVNLTVLIVESDFLHSLHNDMKNAGFNYENHQFIPHITVGAGNQTDQYLELIGGDVELSHIYIRMKDF